MPFANDVMFICNAAETKWPDFRVDMDQESIAALRYESGVVDLVARAQVRKVCLRVETAGSIGKKFFIVEEAGAGVRVTRKQRNGWFPYYRLKTRTSAAWITGASYMHYQE